MFSLPSGRHLLWTALAIVVLGSVQTHADPALKRVRIDLRAEGLLDPLPFDQPFVITGQAPPGVTEVEIAFTELYDDGYVVARRPPLLASFEELARGLLDSTVTQGTEVTARRSNWLREGLAARLTGVAPPPGTLTLKSLSTVLPWNWGSLGALWRSHSVRLVDRSGLLDPDVSVSPSVLVFQDLAASLAAQTSAIDRAVALDALVSYVVRTAGRARVATGPRVVEPPTVVRWHRLDPSGEVRETAPDSDDRWNRLARRLEGGERVEEGTSVSFELIGPELEADRVYVVRTTVRKEVSPHEADRIASAVSVSRTAVSGGDISRAADRTLGGYALSTLDFEIPVVNEDSAASVVARRLRGQQLTKSSSLLSGTEANDYISFDAGLLYVREIGETSAYVGTNLYLRPVDKSVPLSRHGGFLRRFSFTLGLTLQSIEDDRLTRRNLFGTQALVVGAGYRVSQYLKLNAGSLIFRERDPETFPLTEATSLAGSPYVGASFDVDVGEQVKGLGRLFDFLKGGGGK